MICCENAAKRRLTAAKTQRRKEGLMGDGQDWFDTVIRDMNRKRRNEVLNYMHMRPYQGTKLDKELRDAKNRAKANGCREDRGI